MCLTQKFKSPKDFLVAVWLYVCLKIIRHSHMWPGFVFHTCHRFSKECVLPLPLVSAKSLVGRVNSNACVQRDVGSLATLHALLASMAEGCQHEPQRMWRWQMSCAIALFLIFFWFSSQKGRSPRRETWVLVCQSLPLMHFQDGVCINMWMHIITNK